MTPSNPYVILQQSWQPRGEEGKALGVGVEMCKRYKGSSSNSKLMPQKITILDIFAWREGIYSNIFIVIFNVHHSSCNNHLEILKIKMVNLKFKSLKVLQVLVTFSNYKYII